MNKLVLVLGLCLIGCAASNQKEPLVHHVVPTNQKILVIADSHINGYYAVNKFAIVEVEYGTKKHVFLWNYDGNNQSLVKFDEVLLEH